MARNSEADGAQRMTEFERAGDEKPLSLARECMLFLAENKAWWLFPIFIVVGLLGVLVALGASGAAPFIYTLF